MAALGALKSVTLPALTRHTATVIFVHGLGDSGYGWQPVADMFRMDSSLSHVKWVLPHSPERRVTANMGLTMPSWFDIYSFGFDTDEDEKGMLETVGQLSDLIKSEMNAGIAPGQIVLGGFSQGAAMALLTGLTKEYKLGGVAVLSGWLPLHQKFASMVGPHTRSIPIFWGHGTNDPLVKYQFGVASAEYLASQLGISRVSGSEIVGLDFRSYPGVMHSTNQQELDDLKAWLKRVVPPVTAN